MSKFRPKPTPSRAKLGATPGTSSKPATRSVLNGRLLLISLGVVILVAPTLELARRYQVSRTAKAFLDRAAELREQGDWQGASSYQERYHSLRPDEQRVVLEIAETFDRGAQSLGAKRRTIDLLYKAIGVAATSDVPEITAELPELRCRLAELMLDLHQSDPAYAARAVEQVGQIHLDGVPDDVIRRSWRVLALGSLVAATTHAADSTQVVRKTGTLAAAAEGMSPSELLSRSLELTPKDLEAAVALANGVYRNPVVARDLLSPAEQELARQGKLTEQADQIMDRLVSALGADLSATLDRLDGRGGAADQSSEPGKIADRYARIVRQINADPPVLSPGQERFLGEEIAQRIRSGEYPILTRELEAAQPALLAELQGADRAADPSTRAFEALSAWAVGAASQQSLDPNAVRPRLVAEVLRKPIENANREYLQSLLARHEYRHKYGLEGSAADLDLALRHGGDDFATLLVAGRTSWLETSDALREGRTDEAQELGRQGVGLLRKAIAVAPKDERAYLQLGEFLLAFPSIAVNSGLGRVSELGDYPRLEGRPEIRLHFSGANNDVLLRLEESAGLVETVRTLHRKASGDQSLCRIDGDARLLIVDIDPQATTASTLVEAVNKIPGVSAALDPSIDQAVEAWRGGIRAADGASIALHTRLAEVLIGQGLSDRAEEVLSGLDEKISRLALSADRRAMDAAKRSTDLLRATAAISRGQYREAIQRVQSIQADAVTSGDDAAVRQSWSLLGRAYEARGRWSEAARAAEELAALTQDGSPQHRLQAAALWVKAGNFDRALAQHQRVLKSIDDPEVLLAMARTQLERERSLPTNERDWKALDVSVAELQRLVSTGAFSSPWKVALLEVDAAIAQADVDRDAVVSARSRAAEKLRGVEESFPASIELTERLVYAFEDLGLRPDADRTLASLARLTRDSPDGGLRHVLLKSQVQKQRNELEAAEETLKDGLATLPLEAHPSLQESLLRLELLRGELGAAKSRLLDDHRRDPKDPAVVLQLADISLSQKDLKEVERWETTLLEIEGKEGRSYRTLQARRLLSDGAGRPELERARGLLAELLAEDASSLPVKWLLAQAEDRLNNAEEAASLYLGLLNSGYTAVQVYERACLNLCRSEQYEAALNLLDRAKLSGIESALLSEQRLMAMAGTGDYDAALVEAKRGVDGRPEDQQAWMRYGVLLGSSGSEENRARSIEAFQEAARRDPSRLEPYLALCRAYAVSGDEAKAEKTLRIMAENAKAQKVEMESALGDGFSMLGDSQKAEKHYRAALEESPDNLRLKIRIAEITRERDPGAAEKILRSLLADQPDYDPAKQMLAKMLASRRESGAWNEAISILEGGENAENGASSDNLILQARLLVKRGGAERRVAARKLLEQATQSGGLPDAERVLLAQLYEAEGNLPLARREYLTLLNRSKPSPQVMLAFVKLLLRARSFADADQWIDRLAELIPETPPLMELRAISLYEQGRPKEAIGLLDGFATDSIEGQKGPIVAEVAEWTGNAFASMRLYPQAEKWFRRLQAERPLAYRGLAVSLAEQEKVSEAMQVCLDATKRDSSSDPIIGLATVLQTGRGTRDHYEQVKGHFERAMERFPDDVDLRLMLANMMIMLNDNNAAVGLYREALRKEPDNILALNNLAALLSESPESIEEAAEIMERASAITEDSELPSPIEALLADTRGSILLNQGRLDAAIPLLEEAVRLGATEAIYHLHLAAAYQQKGQPQDASRLLARAEDLGLGEMPLRRNDKILSDRLRELAAADANL